MVTTNSTIHQLPSHPIGWFRLLNLVNLFTGIPPKYTGSEKSGVSVFILVKWQIIKAWKLIHYVTQAIKWVKTEPRQNTDSMKCPSGLRQELLKITLNKKEDIWNESLKP